MFSTSSSVSIDFDFGWIKPNAVFANQVAAETQLAHRKDISHLWGSVLLRRGVEGLPVVAGHALLDRLKRLVCHHRDK